MLLEHLAQFPPAPVDRQATLAARLPAVLELCRDGGELLGERSVWVELLGPFEGSEEFGDVGWGED